MKTNHSEIREGSTLTIPVDVGGGAVMSIMHPRPADASGLTWRLLYGDTHQYRAIAASVLNSYDYLLWSEITQAEAIRRLKLLRVARRRAEGLPK